MKTIIHIIYPSLKAATRNLAAVAVLIVIASSFASISAERPRPIFTLPCHENNGSTEVLIVFRFVKSNGWTAYWKNVTIGPVWTASNQTITGFPNADCPSTPTEQNYSFRMDASPPNRSSFFNTGKDIGLK